MYKRNYKSSKTEKIASLLLIAMIGLLIFLISKPVGVVIFALAILVALFYQIAELIEGNKK